MKFIRCPNSIIVQGRIAHRYQVGAVSVGIQSGIANRRIVAARGIGIECLVTEGGIVLTGVSVS